MARKIEIKKGNSKIKIVGNDAGGEYKLKINTDGNMNIKRVD